MSSHLGTQTADRAGLHPDVAATSRIAESTKLAGPTTFRPSTRRRPTTRSAHTPPTSHEQEGCTRRAPLFTTESMNGARAKPASSSKGLRSAS